MVNPLTQQMLEAEFEGAGIKHSNHIARQRSSRTMPRSLVDN